MPYIMMKLNAPADALKPLGEKMKLLMKAQSEASGATPEVQGKLAAEIKKTREALDAKIDNILDHCADGETNSANYDRNIQTLHEAAKKLMEEATAFVKAMDSNGYDEKLAKRVNGLIRQVDTVQQRMATEGKSLMDNMSDYRANSWWQSIVEHAPWRDGDVEAAKSRRLAGINNNQKVSAMQKRVKEYVTRGETLQAAIERIKGTEEKDYAALRSRIIDLVKEIEGFNSDWASKNGNSVKVLVQSYKGLKTCKTLSEAGESKVNELKIRQVSVAKVLKEIRGKLKTLRGKVDEFSKNFPDLRSNDRYFKPQIDKAEKFLDTIAKEEAEATQYDKKITELLKKLK